MIAIRDGIWLIALAVLCCGWYADHAVLRDRARNFEQALRIERSKCAWIFERLKGEPIEIAAE
jgi:hypothetical protein